MRKILAIFDEAHFTESTVQFAARLNKHEPVLLVGIFLPPVDYLDTMVYYFGWMFGPLNFPGLDLREKEENIKRFEACCKENNIECKVHDFEGHIVEHLKIESRFADLMITSNDLFYKDLDYQNDYISEAVHKAECPILIVSEQDHFPENIIVAYDGTASSVFALKQLNYLFPEFAEMSILIVYATEKGNDFPNMSYIEELCARHFKHYNFYKLDADPKKYFNTWLAEKGNTLLVSGSGGRSDTAELLKKSFVREVINEHKIPILIAHL